MNLQEVIEARAQELAAVIVGEKITAFNELIAIQSKSLGSSDYQVGLYNGLILGKSVLTGEQPEFKSVSDAVSNEGGENDGS